MKARWVLQYSAPLIFAFAVYACRITALWGLGELFLTWNLNGETYAYAPQWARHMVDASGEIARLTALLPVFCASVFIMTRRGHGFRLLEAIKWTFVGAIAAGALLGALLAFDSIRLSHTRPAFTLVVPITVIEHIMAALVCAVSARVLAMGKNHVLSLLRSVLGQCLLQYIIYGTDSVVGQINAALFGFAAFVLYAKQKTALPEICFVSAFHVLSTCVFGFGSAGLYETFAVSEAFLTGGDTGITSAFSLTLLLISAILLQIYGNGIKGAFTMFRKKVCSWRKKTYCL